MGLPAEVEELIASLKRQIAALQAEVADLRRQLGQDSSNSSKPPSSIRLGLAFHRALPKLDTKANPRGRTKQRPGHNQLERLKTFKTETHGLRRREQ